MSNRTIIELNHDYGHAIQRDPEAFLGFLMAHINSAGDRDTIEALRHYGVEIVETVHHSTLRMVVIEDQEYRL